MPSPPPLLYNTYYHIYNRGTNRENIFREERNYEYFLKLYIKHIEPVAETFAYCLLRNHFHVLVRVNSEAEIREETLKVSKKPLGSPSQRFSDFFNAYAKAINRAYGRTGSLFQHPFGRVPVTSDRQFWDVIAYIHQNPRKHKFVDDFREWKWSSYGSLLSEQPTRLKRAAVLEWFGGPQRYVELHTQWVTEAESRWFAADDDD
ncbi:MAG: transposase [bacterium]|nr:transposase [bacterium]